MNDVVLTNFSFKSYHSYAFGQMPFRVSKVFKDPPPLLEAHSDVTYPTHILAGIAVIP